MKSQLCLLWLGFFFVELASFLGEGRWYLGRCRGYEGLIPLLKAFEETNGFGISFPKENCFWRQMPSRLFDASNCYRSYPISTLLIWYVFNVLKICLMWNKLPICYTVSKYQYHVLFVMELARHSCCFFQLFLGFGPEIANLTGRGLMPASLK